MGKNSYVDSSILDRAISFASQAHRNVERRGKGFPYIAHPLEAMSIVATMTNDQELLAAACLHDVIEDTDITYEEIKAEFGKRVADIVQAESDAVIPNMSEAESWEQRKQLAIDHLASAPRDVQMVALGDKLSNMRAIFRDYRAIGDELWYRFHVTDPSLHAWHYRGLAKALSPLKDTDAYQEFVYLISETFSDKYNGFSVNVDEQIIYLKGYLNAENAVNLESYLSKEKDNILDFKNVYNVNFSGLRALLNLKEKGYYIVLRQVTNKVRAKMYACGFNSAFITINIPREFDRKKLILAGEGYTADNYYTEDGDASIKLYKSFVQPKDIEQEKCYCSYTFALGIPTPLCGDIVEVDGRIGLLFEKVKGKVSFARRLADNPNDVDNIAKEFVDISKRLHSTPCNTSLFVSAKEKYIPLVESFNGLSEEEKNKVKKFINDSGEDTTCIHGDYHIGNVISGEDKQNLFIDMGDFAYGNKYFDIGTIWFICHAMHDDRVETMFHCSHELLLEFYHHFFKYYFPNVNEADLDEELAKYSALTVMLFASKGGQHDWMLDYVKKHLVEKL